MAPGLPRAVLDTNIIVSALWGGIPGQVVETWLAERYVLLISSFILAEYQSILKRIAPDSPLAVQFLHAIYLKSVAISPKESIDVIRRDPPDNRFLECALAGRADYLVSGDKHLLTLKRFRKTLILTPREFLEKIL